MTDKQLTIFMDWRHTGDTYAVLCERHGEKLHAVKKAIDLGLAARKPIKKKRPKYGREF